MKLLIITFIALSLSALTGCNESLHIGDATAVEYCDTVPEASVLSIELVDPPTTTLLDYRTPTECNWDVFYQEQEVCRDIFADAEGSCNRVRAICEIEPEIIWKESQLQHCQDAGNYWDAVVTVLDLYAPECLSVIDL